MLRHEWIPALIEREHPEISFIEVYPENYMKRSERLLLELESLAAHYPLTSHGVHLSLGGVDPLDAAYLEGIAAFFERFDIPWFSDHLGASVHGGEILHEIFPLPLHRESARRVAARAKEAQARVGRPLLLENTAFYFLPPGSRWSEAEFIREVLEQSDTALLLDVNNLYVNALNHGLSLERTLNALPLERVREIHIGGFTVDAHSGTLIDTHAAAPVVPVWQLLEEVLRRCGPKPVLLEWEANYPSLEAVKTQLLFLEQAWSGARSERKSA